MRSPKTTMAISSARLAQLKELAAQRNMSATELVDELVRAEWTRTQTSVPVPMGFICNYREGDTPCLLLGGDNIGAASLTVDQAQDFIFGARDLLTGNRNFVMAVSSSTQFETLDITKQGRGFVMSTIRGQGSAQEKRSQAISRQLLKDLISAIIDRAGNKRASPLHVPQSGAPEAGSF